MKTAREILDKKPCSLSNNINSKPMYRERIVLNAMEEYANQFKSIGVEKKVSDEEIWNNACKKTLKDISKTFADNAERGDTIRDCDIYQAIAETIESFPVESFPVEKPIQTISDDIGDIILNVCQQEMQNGRLIIEGDDIDDFVNRLANCFSDFTNVEKVSDAVERPEQKERFIFPRFTDNIKTEKMLPLNQFLKAVDEYVSEQENHILKRDEGRMATIKAVAHWCKRFAETLAR